MAGPFSVAQANRALPLISRIVDDLMRYHARWQEMIAACELLLASNSPRSHGQVLDLQREIQQTAAEIDRFRKELDDLGVFFKDFEAGLVDFPGLFNDRDILLCWKIGESSVEYWHEVDAGFTGRQPITAEIG
jgi:hypothetical protein